MKTNPNQSYNPTPWKHVATDGGWDGIADLTGNVLFRVAYNNPENCDIVVQAVNDRAAMLDTIRKAAS